MSDPRAPHPQGPQFPGRPHHAPYQQAPQVGGQLPHPYAHPYAQPFPAPPAGPRPVRSLAGALGALAGFSVLAPVGVMLLGVLWYSLKWIVAMALVVFTGGFIAADPDIERWLLHVISWETFNEEMSALLPWALGSFLLSLVIGGLTLLLLRATTAVKHWHPALQGMLGSLAGVLSALALGLFVGA